MSILVEPPHRFTIAEDKPLRSESWPALIGDRIATALEKRPGCFFFGFVLIYSLITMARAKRRFWYDELFTVYLSRLPHWSDIQAALKGGVDFNPPLIYLTTRLSHRLFGVTEITTRLPELIGFLVMCFALFVFVRRRCGILYAFAAMCFPLLTAAYRYAFEARPYGLVLAFCGLASVFWQAAAQGGRRRGALALLSLSIAGLVMSHCYSVLVLVAFGAAELTRLVKRKRADWPLWAALTAPMALCIPVYLPMLQNVKAYAIQGSISFTSGLSLVPRFYSFLFNDQERGWEKPVLHETVWVLLIVLIMVALARRNEAADFSETSATSKLSVHEAVYLVALGLLPVFGQALAQFTHAPFLDRYALSAVIGISALLSILASHATAGNRRVAAAMVLLFSAWFVVDFGTWFASLVGQRPWDLPVIDLSSLPKDELIVITDPLMFLEADFYEPPAVASRLRFLTDRPSALHYIGTDTFDRGYYTMRRWFPIRGEVVEYSDFLAATRHFLVYGPFLNPEDWVFRHLAESHADLNMRGEFRYPASHGDENMLVEVTQPR